MRLRLFLAGFHDVRAYLFHIDGGQRKPLGDPVDARGVVGVDDHVYNTVRLLLVDDRRIQNAVLLGFLGKQLQVLRLDSEYLGGLAVERPHTRLTACALLVFECRDKKCGKG